jgi:hypothetical protein
MTWLHLVLSVLVLGACSEDPTVAAAAPERATTSAAPAPTATASAAPVSAAEPTASARRRSYDQKCEPADEDLKALELVEFQLTSEVKDKKPVDEIERTQPGKDVWAYMAVKNRSGEERCVTVIFRVNGKKRASVTLDVGESPSWRTWAHNRVLDGDAPGKIEVEIVSDQDVSLKKKTLPIEANRQASAGETAGQPAAAN